VSDPRHDQEELMRYLDGELASRDARLLEKRLAESPALQRTLDALVQMREVVRARYHAAADEAQPRLAGLWDRIEGQLAAPEPARASARPAAVRGLWAGVRGWLDAYRGHLLTGALSAAAGAVLAIVALRSMGGGIEQPQPPPPVAVAEAAEVESLEVEDGTGTIFQIPADEAGGAATTVIWVTPHTEEEPTGPEGPI